MAGGGTPSTGGAGSQSFGALGCASLAAALASNRSLTALGICQCAGVDCYAVRALCRGLGAGSASLGAGGDCGPNGKKYAEVNGGWSEQTGWGGMGKRNLASLVLADCAIGSLGCEALAKM